MQVKIFHRDDISEKLKTRNLYEENFDIGKKDFINYYYDTIIKRNEIIVLLDDKEIISMIHLNPYKYFVFDKVYNVHYFVAIATKEGYRGKGYISKLFYEAMDYLKGLNEPFCYLVPEKYSLESFYNKFGFESICKFTIDKFSKEKYDIYPVNDEEYNQLMFKEDYFLKLESKDYIEDLSKKNVMIKILDTNSELSIDMLRNSHIYICQEV